MGKQEEKNPTSYIYRMENFRYSVSDGAFAFQHFWKWIMWVRNSKKTEQWPPVSYSPEAASEAAILFWDRFVLPVSYDPEAHRRSHLGTLPPNTFGGKCTEFSDIMIDGTDPRGQISTCIRRGTRTILGLSEGTLFSRPLPLKCCKIPDYCRRVDYMPMKRKKLIFTFWVTPGVYEKWI